MRFMRLIYAAVSLSLPAAQALAQAKPRTREPSDRGSTGGKVKSGEIKIPRKDPMESDPTRPSRVGTLSAPTRIDLDPEPVSAGRKILTWIGFHQAPTYSRIFFKTSETAHFEIQPGPGLLRVVFKNASIRLRNNLRLIDASFFRSAVWQVIPKKERDTVVVEIQMREAVSYRARRRQGTIYLDFDLPAKR
jgi:hypothetical protein